jgi:hypothetical protein
LADTVLQHVETCTECREKVSVKGHASERFQGIHALQQTGSPNEACASHNGFSRVSRLRSGAVRPCAGRSWGMMPGVTGRGLQSAPDRCPRPVLTVFGQHLRRENLHHCGPRRARTAWKMDCGGAT